MDKIVVYEKAHSSLETGLQKMARTLKSFDIDAQDAEFQVSRIASRCREARDIAKDRCKRELEPYEPEAKRIRARWKPLIDGFDAAFKRAKTLGQDILRRKRAEQEKARAEANRKLLAAQKAEAKAKTQQALAKAHETSETLQEQLDALPPEGAPIGVRTEETTLYPRKVLKWETVDVNKVPDEYCQRLVDSHKVDFAIKNGVREISGIRIWEDEEMVSRRNV